MPTIALADGRTYEWRPFTADSTPRPLIVALHETNHTGLTFESESNLSTQATTWGMHLAYGNGVNGKWNVGGGWPAAWGGTADDVSYLADLYDDASGRASVDVSQVFICGMSAGGAMAWRAAGDDTRWVAAGSVAGWAPTDPDRAVDLMHIHGWGDTTVPLAGGLNTTFGYTFPPTYRESFRLNRPSRWSLMPWNGGHAWPGWAGQVLHDFWINDRAQP